MKKYLVTFKSLLPVQVDTIIEAENDQQLIHKLENKDIGQFHFKTIGDFRNIHDLIYKEINDE